MKNISNVFKGVLVVVSIAVLSTGCSTHIPVNKEVGTLNLKSEEFKQEAKVNHVIAIVSPVFAANDENTKAQNRAGMSKYEMALAARMQVRGDYSFQRDFSGNYVKRLSNAFESSISEMISAKGFKLQGPYSEFDDMTYSEKKKIYLAFVPKVDFKIDQKVLKSENHRLYTHQEGVIQIGGSVIVTMVEPMTGEVFLKKRINLSDFHIEEPYIYERQFKTRGGLNIGTAIDKASAPDELIDTTDVALTKAINDFYTKAMEKLDRYLDKEEILSYEKDILKLKGLKRF